MSWDAIIQLDKELLLLVNGSSSLFVDGLAMTLTDALTWIPLYAALLYMVVKNNDNMLRVLLIVACAALCVVLAGTLNDTLVKPTVCRPRPTRDLEIGALVDIVDGYRGGRYGFFSSHAANTFSIAIFFSLLIRHKALTFFLVLWSLLNCWTRMYLGVHYPGDILCGLLWGGFVGTAMHFLCKFAERRFFMKSKYVSEQYTLTGYKLSDIDIVISVLTLTFVYAAIRACLMLS
ncbi:MAG: phosphatase PAP2 family protein [Prevotella sp.]|nr:phosphatase PAP2 family protein [Prevotella sp.]